VRPTEDIISLWNRTASDNAITARIRYVPALNVLVDVVYILQMTINHVQYNAYTCTQ